MSEKDGREILPWLKLQATPGIGALRFARLIEKLKHPARVLNTPEETLSAISGISSRMAAAIRDTARLPDAPFLREIRMAGDQGVHLIGLGMEAYPELLSKIPDPPPVLYVRGQLLPDAVAVAIVGSRNATRYGRDHAFSIASELAASGIVVVSGLARGIDAAAHEGALAAGGVTIAVLGSGLSRIYPGEHRRLAQSIAASGAVISSFAMETLPDAPNFPARNRIISGLCLGTAVMEAADRSGSLITARMAGEQGRDVFALPGNVRSMKSAGTHRLLREGACLIENAADIMNELGIQKPHVSVRPHEKKENLLAMDESGVFKVLEADPIHIDELAQRTGMAAGPLSALLFTLELQGKILQYPGKYFAKS
ncbi:DNA-processing protein DprA [Desulfobotulus alkaliphilus]|nr:DNA-processing protein DprA [Desulfobotulus alkaliphilus]